MKLSLDFVLKIQSKCANLKTNKNARIAAHFVAACVAFSFVSHLRSNL